MNNDEKSLQDATRALTREHERSIEQGGGSPLEADTALNDASRTVVEAMRRAHGDAWLAKLHPHWLGVADDVPRLWRWDQSTVMNFSADFVLPRFDAELDRLLLEHRRAPFISTRDVMKRVFTILLRVDAAGGTQLFWG